MKNTTAEALLLISLVFFFMSSRPELELGTQNSGLFFSPVEADLSLTLKRFKVISVVTLSFLIPA